jgi:hypothetical protein
MIELIREARPRHSWTQVNNQIIDDERLSMEAGMLMVWLISRPPGWVINISHLRERFTIGKDKLYKLVRELEQAGWLKRVPIRESGKFATVRYVILDALDGEIEPHPEKPCPRKPAPVFSASDSSASSNTTSLIKTHSTKTHSTKTHPSTPLSPPSSEKESTRAARAGNSARKKSEKTTMPADWVLTAGLRERIRTEAKMPDGLIDADVAKACRHYREGNGRSTRHVNWDLAIFNWCDKTMRDSANQGGRPNGSTSRPNGYGSKPLKTPELEARVIAEWTTKVADLGWAQPPSPRMAGYSYKVREEQPKEIQDQWMKAHQLLMRMESEAYREPGV